MSNGSSIPGEKPPPAVIQRVQASSTLPVDQAGSSAINSLGGGAQGKIDTSLDLLKIGLNRPTSEIFDEAGAVVSWAVEDSKTVGGLGVNLLTICALVAASPWSWVAMLLLGPARVWGIFYAGVLAAVGSAFGFAFSVLLLLVFAVVAIFGWFIIRALF